MHDGRQFLIPCPHDFFANEIQELIIGRLSSLSGKSTGEVVVEVASSRLLFASFTFSSFSSRRVLNLLVSGASSPCNGNHFLVLNAFFFTCICDRIWENSPLCALLQNRVIVIQG